MVHQVQLKRTRFMILAVRHQTFRVDCVGTSGSNRSFQMKHSDDHTCGTSIKYRHTVLSPCLITVKNIPHQCTEMLHTTDTDMEGQQQPQTLRKRTKPPIATRQKYASYVFAASSSSGVAWPFALQRHHPNGEGG